MHFFVEICTFKPVTGLTTLCVAESPLTGEGLSSFDFLFSGRGGRNAVGDEDGVFEELLLEFVIVLPLVTVDVVVVVLVVVPVVVLVLPPLPLAPPFLNLL